MKKVFIVGMLLLISVTFVFGQAAEEKPEITVLVWETDDPEKSQMIVHGEEFEKQTGIKVNFTTMGFYDVSTRMATVFASGNDAVDAFASWKGSVQRFARPGYLYDLSEELGNDYFDSFTASIESFKYEDGVYGLPKMHSLKMFYYNKELFEEAGLDPDQPPQTWEELIEAAKATTRDSTGDGSIDQWGLLPTGIGAPDNAMQDFELLYYLSGGGPLFDENDNPTFNSPAGKMALEKYIELYELEVIDPASWTISGGQDRRTRFMQGNTAMVFEWPSLWKLANTSRESKIQDKVGMALIPAIEQTAGISGDEGLSISAFSNNKEEALEFLKFIASEEINRDNTLRTGWLPVRNSLMEDPEIADDPILGEMMETAAKQGEYYVDRFAAPYSSEISNEVLGYAIVDAVEGSRSIDEALEWAEKNAIEVVDKYR